jgi:hypothetical protein
MGDHIALLDRVIHFRAQSLSDPLLLGVVIEKQQTVSQGSSASSASSRCRSSIVSSAVNGSLTVPMLCFPSPCGSGPTHSEKP